jgi:hypothetical protein
MRCPDCNKFASMDSDSDPEITLDVDDRGVVTGSVHIDNNCGDCGTTLKTADIDVEEDFSDVIEGHIEEVTKNGEHEATEEGYELTVEFENEERAVRTEGKGRGARTYYGAQFTIKLHCSCGAEWSRDVTAEVQASAMEEA